MIAHVGTLPDYYDPMYDDITSDYYGSNTAARINCLTEGGPQSIQKIVQYA